ncbi:hypothetical protein KAV46_05825, partial [Candidatus Bathyarchaeota archaeon]|nr:hypothetical protein [Candidatus Bathyarchaeota archaeon]
MRKTTSILIGLIVSITILTPVMASAEMPSGKPKEFPAPKPGPGSIQMNMTDTVPQMFSHQLVEGVPQVLRFRNMVMEVTANRQMTMSVTSDDSVKLRYFSMNMTMTRNMHLDIQAN